MILTFLFNRLWSSFCAGNNIMANFRPLNLNDLLNPLQQTFGVICLHADLSGYLVDLD